jgi:hypothetical protein
MPRLLVLCRHPYHLSREEAAAWLEQELERVLHADELEGATLTPLASPCAQGTREWDWLIEFEGGRPVHPVSGRSACGELLADLRLLGMAPAAALADGREAIELRRP